jgi:hypothetical protein
MLWSYTLTWTHDREAQEITNLRWIEAYVAGDARSTAPWEFLSPARLTADALATYANEQWCLPTTEDGEEFLTTFDGLPVEEDHHCVQE